MTIDSTILRHYEEYLEQGRLSHGHGLLEGLRVREILQRYLPASPAVIADIGGGPGAYALWLGRLGHTVHLVDASPRHITQARAAAAEEGGSLASAIVGDARRLPLADGLADLSLLMGPLYHLVDRADRLLAWREAARVARPGARVIGTAISRTASAVSSLATDRLDDPIMRQIIETDLRTGQHQNPTGDPHYFTTAYFHQPEELADEVHDAGLICEGVLGIEGPASCLPDLERTLADPDQRSLLLELLARLEREPSLLGVSFHLLAVARVP